jgi:hypothetical protein
VGRAGVRVRELVGRALYAQRELLRVAHRPAPVAEMAPQLTEDGGHGERGERGLAVGSTRSIALSSPTEATARGRPAARRDRDSGARARGPAAEALDQRVARSRR